MLKITPSGTPNLLVYRSTYAMAPSLATRSAAMKAGLQKIPESFTLSQPASPPPMIFLRSIGRTTTRERTTYLTRLMNAAVNCILPTRLADGSILPTGLVESSILPTRLADSSILPTRLTENSILPNPPRYEDTLE